MATQGKYHWKMSDFHHLGTPEQNKIGVWLYFDQMFNDENWDAAKILAANSYTYNGKPTHSTVEDFVKSLHKKYQNFHLEVVDMVSEDDTVALHWVVTAELDGKPITTYGINMLSGLVKDEKKRDISNWQGNGPPPE